MKLYDKAAQAAEYIRARANINDVTCGVILGTGLSGLREMIEQPIVIAYDDIPYMPSSTVESHAGQLIIGTLHGVRVAAFAGRFHYYEGYSEEEITFGVRVLGLLGAEALFVGSAVGGLQGEQSAGDIALIRDHINLLPINPLRGENDERFGPRFPDMMKSYDELFRQAAHDIAQEENIKLHNAVYVATQGPSLETPAEYQYMNRIGGDVVGMSTVPEVIAARHQGIRVCVLGVISNVCFPLDRLTKTTIEEVLKTVEEAAPKMQLLVSRLIQTTKLFF